VLCCVVVVVTEVLEMMVFGEGFYWLCYSVFLGWEGAVVAFVFGHQFVFFFLMNMQFQK